MATRLSVPIPTPVRRRLLIYPKFLPTACIDMKILPQKTFSPKRLKAVKIKNSIFADKCDLI